MLAIVTVEPLTPGLSPSADWRGRSGRVYALFAVRLADFALDNGSLCLLAHGSDVLWVGSANEIVGDQASRARFRLALDCADRAFWLPAPTDEVTRMTLIWDLEDAEPAKGPGV